VLWIFKTSQFKHPKNRLSLQDLGMFQFGSNDDIKYQDGNKGQHGMTNYQEEMMGNNKLTMKNGMG
jgi:hypothetical protein